MKINLFDSAVIACKRANDSEIELRKKVDELNQLSEINSSNITVACMRLISGTYPLTKSTARKSN